MDTKLSLKMSLFLILATYLVQASENSDIGCSKQQLNDTTTCNCQTKPLEFPSVSDIIVSGRLNPSDKRFPTFKRALDLMIERNAMLLIETGTTRTPNPQGCENDGCSTLIFSHYAALVGAKFYSIDISEENCRSARSSMTHFRDAVDVIASDSLVYLEMFNKGAIDFLYLDSMDWDFRAPEVSGFHHLEEIKRIYDRLHKKTIILLDDCDLPSGGKCGKVHDFLIERGWNQTVKAYQQLYLFESS